MTTNLEMIFVIEFKSSQITILCKTKQNESNSYGT